MSTTLLPAPHSGRRGHVDGALLGEYFFTFVTVAATIILSAIHHCSAETVAGVLQAGKQLSAIGLGGLAQIM